MTIPQSSEFIARVAKIIKKKFTNLTVEDTLELASQIVTAAVEVGL